MKVLFPGIVGVLCKHTAYLTTPSQQKASVIQLKMDDALAHKKLRIYCSLKWWSLWMSDERKQSPLLEKQTKCARLKAMASEIVSFLSMVYSSCEAKKGGVLGGASLFWGRVQLACSFTWLCEPTSGRPLWASPPSRPGWGPPGSSKSLFSPEGSSANL